MTLPIVDNKDTVEPMDGPKYLVGPNCCNPSCVRFADDAHHMFRRSGGFGPQDWIAIDGYVTANKVGVCAACHRDLTGRLGGHQAAIRWQADTKLFWWCLVGEKGGLVAYHPTFPIEPQPPTPSSLVERAPDNPSESDPCPQCGQRRRRTPSTAGSRRGLRRRSWTMKVPDEEVENGADVLDALLEGIAPLVPNGDATTTGRYYVVVAALAYANQDLTRFGEAFSGVGG